MSIIQSILTTPTGAMAFYLGIGVLILVAGWAADSMLGMNKKSS